MKLSRPFNFVALCITAVLATYALTTDSVKAAPIAVGDHSFEDTALGVNGVGGVPAPWSATGGGAGTLNGFAAQGLEPRPDGSSQNAWSNGSDLYQTLGTAVTPNTTYTLTVDIGDRNDTAFPLGDTELRLGSGAAFGTNGLQLVGESRPIPSNPGWTTWTSTFESGPSPVAGALRVEVLGNLQSQFDNVHLDAVPAAPVDPLAPRDVFVRNHSFEGNGSTATFVNGVPDLWQASGAGGGGWMGGFRPELIPRPDGTDTHAWSNGQDLYQVTGEVITANTLYTLRVDVGDRSDTCCIVPLGTAIRLGAGGVFGADLIAPDSIVNPEPNSGWETWTVTAFIEEGNPLVGQTLRVELFDPGGPQPMFDDVRLTAQTIAAIPEPSTLILATLGLLSLGMTRRRTRR